MQGAHVAARSAFRYYPPRAPVADEQVPWSVTCPGYTPTLFTAPHVLENARDVKPQGWADPADSAVITDAEWQQRTSYEGPIAFGGGGLPLNPRGRTGMAERGYLVRLPVWQVFVQALLTPISASPACRRANGGRITQPIPL